MAIDISNLIQEKTSFLMVNPDFLKSLEHTIPSEVHKVQKRHEKLRKTKSKFQRDLEDAKNKIRKTGDKLRHGYVMDANLRKIQRNLIRNAIIVSKLICPECGQSDKGNRMNGKPWCFKCNTVLFSEAKIRKWKKTARIKVVEDNLREDLERLSSLTSEDV